MSFTSAEQTLADEHGLHVALQDDAVLNLFFDGRRIWSVSTATGYRDAQGWVHVAWPERMRRRLKGYAYLEVKSGDSGEVLAASAVRFGDTDKPLDFTDSAGRPVTLNKWGRFNYTFDSTPREVVDGYLDQVEEVLTLLRTECGLDPFISFGTLLGAVREGKMIGHDVDVDLGYISRFGHPVDLVRESLGIERTLREHGYKTVRNHGGFIALFFSQVDGSTRNLDIFPAFFVEDMLYQVNDIGTPGTWSDVLPLQSLELEGRLLPAPARPNVFLEAAYGPTWQVPDPGFTFTTARSTKRRMLGWFGGLRGERDAWNRHYQRPKARAKRGPSAFARWVAAQEPDVQILDIGCGPGRNANYFASLGRDVIGVDFSGPAIKTARRRSTKLPGESRFVKVNLYSVGETLRFAAQLAHEPRPRVILASGLLEDLRSDGRDSFWRICSMLLRGGQRCYIELGASGKGAQVPSGGQISPEVLIREASRRGGRHVEVDGLAAIEPAGRGRATTRIVLEW